MHLLPIVALLTLSACSSDRDDPPPLDHDVTIESANMVVLIVRIVPDNPSLNALFLHPQTIGGRYGALIVENAASHALMDQAMDVYSERPECTYFAVRIIAAGTMKAGNGELALDKAKVMEKATPKELEDRFGFQRGRYGPGQC
ncbi:hypothetical protein [Sphingosinithalassobacter portus]|uniref:hypothetical protein n=1 Tax=Stakelama portus TaxID=2676234 RepID=UPI000D6E83F8|nr:hypothetical protein [Sphingosinithalassobacter portus]